MRPADLRDCEKNLRVTVSGSFHRHMESIAAAVQELVARSIRVLSPADPRVVANNGEFLFVASDRVRSVRLVQDRHLESVRAADFLWLVCPDGYVGQSASMEIGFAAAMGVPIYSTHPPSDLTLREYITVVPSLSDAVHKVESSVKPRSRVGILIDPHASAEEAHHILERVDTLLSRSSSLDEPARRVHREMIRLQTTLRLPTRMH
jgi:hypothetical protein